MYQRNKAKLPLKPGFHYRYKHKHNNNNNNNFIICIEYKTLDSLPRKIAGKLVVTGQDKYTNNIY